MEINLFSAPDFTPWSSLSIFIKRLLTKEFDEEEKIELEKIFWTFDEDDDGILSRSEFRSCLRFLYKQKIYDTQQIIPILSYFSVSIEIRKIIRIIYSNTMTLKLNIPEMKIPEEIGYQFSFKPCINRIGFGEDVDGLVTIKEPMILGDYNGIKYDTSDIMKQYKISKQLMQKFPEKRNEDFKNEELKWPQHVRFPMNNYVPYWFRNSKKHAYHPIDAYNRHVVVCNYNNQPSFGFPDFYFSTTTRDSDNLKELLNHKNNTLEILRRFDENGDGILSREETMRCLSFLDQHGLYDTGKITESLYFNDDGNYEISKLLKIILSKNLKQKFPVEINEAVNDEELKLKKLFKKEYVVVQIDPVIRQEIFKQVETSKKDASGLKNVFLGVTFAAAVSFSLFPSSAPHTVPLQVTAATNGIAFLSIFLSTQFGGWIDKTTKWIGYIAVVATFFQMMANFFF